MRIKRIISGTLAAAIAVSLCACGGGTENKSGEKKHILVTFGNSEISNANETDKVFASFLAEHPDYEIEVNNIASTDPKMLAMIASGNAPDIIRMNAPYDIPTYVVRNMLLPIDDYVKESKLINMKDTYDTVNMFRFDGHEIGKGKLYGLPKDWSINSQMWINKQLFDEAGVRVPTAEDPMTFDEFADACKKLTKFNADGTVAQIGAQIGSSVYSMVEYMLNQKGKSYWKDDFSGTTTFDDPDTMAAIEWMFDLAKNNYIISNLNKINDFNWFMEGKLAMWMSGYWTSSYFRDENNKTLTVPLEDIILVPGPVLDKSKPYSSTFNVTGGSISKDSKDPDAAFKVLEFISAGEVAKTRAETGYGFQLQKSMAEFLPRKTDFDKKCIESTERDLKNLNTDMRINPYINTASIEASFNKYYMPALYGKTTLEEALKSIEDDIKNLVSEGKEIVGDK